MVVVSAWQLRSCTSWPLLTCPWDCRTRHWVWKALVSWPTLIPPAVHHLSLPIDSGNLKNYMKTIYCNVFICPFLCIHLFKHGYKIVVKNLSSQNRSEPFWAPSTKNAISSRTVQNRSWLVLDFWGFPEPFRTVLGTTQKWPQNRSEPFWAKGKNISFFILNISICFDIILYE